MYFTLIFQMTSINTTILGNTNTRKTIIPKTAYLCDRDYIMRILYKNCY